jgi:membrane associated rhomboid family serine protease
MATVRYDGPADQDPLTLEVCTNCQLVWFDAKERERLPAKSPPKSAALPGQTDLSLSPEAREAIAAFELSRRPSQPTFDIDDEEGPDATWQYLPAIFGLPVECEVPELSSRPWLTWAISAVLVIMTMVPLFAGGTTNSMVGTRQETDGTVQVQETNALTRAVSQWGFVPKEFWRYGGLTLLTSFFVHAGLFHMLSNVYFLMIFGDHVEMLLGRWRYLLLLAAATLAGNLLHAALDPHGTIPLVGASGGICGVIAYYALAFPHAQLGFLWWWGRFYWFRLSAIGWLAFYVVLQFMGAWQQMRGTGNVSSLAHLGGLAVGLVAGLWAMRRHLIPIELTDA